MANVELDHWPNRLEAAIAAGGALFTKATVLRETDSTQDAARRLGAGAGEVVVAARQTAGRGRLGRRWHDTVEDGLAVTLVIAADEPARLAVAAALAVAEAIESVCPHLRGRVGLKWPNDVMIARLKVAGILVEQADRLAYVGVGINVHQLGWPPALAGRAISLAEAGAEIDRVDLAAALIGTLGAAMQRSNERLSDDFAARDVLRGSVVTLRHGGRTSSGTVVHVDPMRGLALRSEAGEIWIPAATAMLIS